uniref:Uncharacterized protein n=1 Tax=Oryza barthii TaxID=65489 RepID=A0A0D3F814_9ORYZ
MGLCCSKTQKETTPPHGGAEATTSPQVKRKSGKIAADDKGKKTRAGRAVEAAGDKKAVFVVKTKSGAVNVEERRPVVVVPTMPVRTSSCTKEEVDAILIQCGRLSRSWFRRRRRRRAGGNENAGGGQMTAAQTPSLSRSSSPYRRSPMVEIDENSLRNNNGANRHKKISENALAIAAAPQKATARSKEKPKVVEETVLVAAAPPASKTTATRTASATAESLNTKARSRRASRDFDQNTNSYATQLLEDIQSYHQQQNTTSVAATAATLPSFSLPACVSKACSILDAVADLNSSSSDSHSCEPDRSANDRGSVNAPLGGGMDDLAEPGVHKRHATAPRGDIRGGGGETEPQESAGSNSVSGNPWTPSWEPNSVESTDRTWSASRSTNNGDEVVEQGSSSHAGARSPLNRSRQSSKQRAAQPEHSVRSRAGSSGVYRQVLLF